MLVQLVVNKNKLGTSGNKILAGICDSIENKVKSIKGASKKYESAESIYGFIDEFKTMVYDKRAEDCYLSEECKVKLNMSVALENIVFLDETIKGLNKLDKKNEKVVNKISDKAEVMPKEFMKDILEKLFVYSTLNN